MRNSRVIDINIHNMDDLAICSDDELRRLEHDLYATMDRATKRGWDPTSVEVELAYIQREWQIRHARTSYHSSWLDRMRRELQEEERNLPVFVHSEPFFADDRRPPRLN